MVDGVAGTRERARWLARVAAPGCGLVLVGLAFAEVVMVIVVAFAVTLIPLWIGVYLFPAAASRLRALATCSRTLAARWSGVAVREPEPWPEHRGAVGRLLNCWAILSDRGFWREVVWAIVDPLSGAVLACVPFALVVYGFFGAFVQPFVWEITYQAGGNQWYGPFRVDTSIAAVLSIPLGLAITAVGLWSGPWWLGRHARLTRSLLAPGRAELARRVERLTDTRAEAVDRSAAELRRIERDLHDGAQARLVAMGMNLDEAERELERDPAAARALLLQARQASSTALQELRDLVRGIHPPVLADRGLPDAVRALSLDSALDVTVNADVGGRLAPPVESAAYFAISEILANATKHAAATLITIYVRHDGARLLIEVSDNGHGGADPSRGTGLHGIRRRLAAFDGSFAVRSPAGGPTSVRMEIPCALSSPKTSSS